MQTPNPSQSPHPITQTGLKFTHTLPAMTVALLLLLSSLYFTYYSTKLESNYVHALARLPLEQNITGVVMQEAALRTNDLLPVFGSSEMVPNRYTANIFNMFEKYPTGFYIMNISRPGNTSLNVAQTLASLGPELRGEKIVVSFTPSMFTDPKARENLYAGNFSHMHAVGMIFSPFLSMNIKRRAALRMMDYPETLGKDPLLVYAIQNLAQKNYLNDLVYELIFPLGQLDFATLRLQDHFAISYYIYSHPALYPKIPRQETPINWSSVVSSAEIQQKANTSDNKYGIENREWKNQVHLGFQFRSKGSYDGTYLKKIKTSKEWDDFKILLDVIKETGAKPLILSRPINGRLYNASGVSRETQLVFYKKLAAIVDPYGYPLVDFQKYTYDRFFSIDYTSHPSPKGVLLAFQVLDSFFHDTLSY